MNQSIDMSRWLGMDCNLDYRQSKATGKYMLLQARNRIVE
jgi:hypothetical protein